MITRIVPNGPSHLTFLLGWRCNAACEMCWQAVSRRKGVPQPELPYAEFEALIKRYPRLISIEFCSFGEPTLHPSFGRMLDLLLEDETQWQGISLITNGSRLSQFPQLAALPGGLTISIDSPDPNTYASIRRGLSLHHVLNEVQLFQKYPKHPRILEWTVDTWLKRTVGVNMVLIKRNLTQLEAMAELCTRLQLDYLHLLRGAVLEMTPAAGQEITDEEAIAVAPRVRALQDKYPALAIVDWVSNTTSRGTNLTPPVVSGVGYCALPWDRLDIGPDGTAHPCCRAHRINLGSAITSDPWLHPEIAALRTQLETDQLDAQRFIECTTCPMRRGAGT